jgi:hypothetical protein
MSSIRVKITDSNQPEPWWASAWCPPGKTPEQTVKDLNRKAKAVYHIGKVTYELATEQEYQAYRNSVMEP